MTKCIICKKLSNDSKYCLDSIYNILINNIFAIYFCKTIFFFFKDYYPKNLLPITHPLKHFNNSQYQPKNKGSGCI